MCQLSAVLVLGGSGFVGSRVLELVREHHERVIAPSHAELDLLHNRAVEELFKRSKPEAVVNLAASADVDGAEAERGNPSGRVYALNAELPGRLAALCNATGAHLLHVSTDYVFDGMQHERPYREDDPPRPLSWYAQTKRIGEERALERYPEACVARIEMPFSGRPHAKSDFARLCRRRLEAGETIAGVTDQRITPVFLDDAAQALRLLSEERTSAIVHVASTDWTTPYRFARSIAERLHLNVDLVRPTSFEAFSTTRPAPRPQHPWLDTTRFTSRFGGGILRTFEEELAAWAEQLTEAVTVRESRGRSPL